MLKLAKLKKKTNVENLKPYKNYVGDVKIFKEKNVTS